MLVARVGEASGLVLNFRTVAGILKTLYCSKRRESRGWFVFQALALSLSKTASLPGLDVTKMKIEDMI